MFSQPVISSCSRGVMEQLELAPILLESSSFVNRVWTNSNCNRNRSKKILLLASCTWAFLKNVVLEVPDRRTWEVRKILLHAVVHMPLQKAAIKRITPSISRIGNLSRKGKYILKLFQVIHYRTALVACTCALVTCCDRDLLIAATENRKRVDGLNYVHVPSTYLYLSTRWSAQG